MMIIIIQICSVSCIVYDIALHHTCYIYIYYNILYSVFYYIKYYYYYYNYNYYIYIYTQYVCIYIYSFAAITSFNTNMLAMAFSDPTGPIPRPGAPGSPPLKAPGQWIILGHLVVNTITAWWFHKTIIQLL